MNVVENKKLVIYIFLILPFFKPVGLCYYRFFDTLFKLGKTISIIYISLNIIGRFKIKNFLYIIPLLIFWIIYVSNSIIYGTDFTDILNNAITSLILIIFIKQEFNNNKEILFKALSYIFFSYILLQIISMIFINITSIRIFDIYNGKTYFLGQDNYSAFSIIPMVTILIFLNYQKNKRITEFDMLLLVTLSLCYAIVKSYTASFCLFSFTMSIFLLKNNKNILKYVSLKKIVIGLCILLFLIITVKIQNLFSYILVNVIGKGLTLNSRTIIWNDAIQLIKSKFIFGYGSLLEEQISLYYLYGASHTHNFLLELLLRTGLVGTIAYFIFVSRSVNTIYKHGKTDYGLSILIIGLISYVVLSFMDFYPVLQFQYCLLGILYCYRNNIKGVDYVREYTKFKTKNY